MKTATNKPKIIQKILSISILVIGVLLAIFKIVEDSEPGAIPLFLIIAGIGWFALTSFRAKSE